MKKSIIPILAAGLLLSGCGITNQIKEKITGDKFDDPVVESSLYLRKENNQVLAPQEGPITVGVYSFRDLTGQRKNVPNIASLSSAVTQGADAFLIKALQEVGNGRWFVVVERNGLENLVKERQMIRQMREMYQGKDAKPLPPLMLAGVLMEGGIIGYDSNTVTGGAGVRIFGIGATTQYQSDTVTVNLRTISVASGEVLTSVTVTKTVLSYLDKVSMIRFFSDGEKSLEGEIGGGMNESINKATAMAIEAAVLDTIKTGVQRGHWNYKPGTETPVATPVATPVVGAPIPLKPVNKDVDQSVINVNKPKNELKD